MKLVKFTISAAVNLLSYVPDPPPTIQASIEFYKVGHHMLIAIVVWKRLRFNIEGLPRQAHAMPCRSTSYCELKSE